MIWRRLLSLLSRVLTTTGLCHFGNAGATYHRAATTLFHDMIVKSRDRANHLAALQRFFERIRLFRLRLNPKKYTFGVTSGKLLGLIISE